MGKTAAILEQVLWRLRDGTLIIVEWIIVASRDDCGTVEIVIIVPRRLVIIPERNGVITVQNSHYGDYYGIERNMCY